MRGNLGLIFAGLLFFALPNFNLLDIMPDFIGAILIMSGLSKMYMYDGNFEDARKSAKFLLWVSVLRLVFCFWSASGGRRDYLLPFTFIICVLEAIYMIALFKGLYLGLEYTLMRAGSERLTKKTNEAFTMSIMRFSSYFSSQYWSLRRKFAKFMHKMQNLTCPRVLHLKCRWHK